MAHEITSTDALFSTRMPTWHGLGTIFTDYPTREEAQSLAHPWEPVSEPVYRGNPVVAEGCRFPEDDGQCEVHAGEWCSLYPVEERIEVEYEKIEGFQAIVRSDNNHTLGIVGDGYEPVNNNELWDIAEALEGSGVDVCYETAGSLQGGRKVWVLLKLQDPVEIKGDPNGATLPYYALQNSHDGTTAFRGQAIMTRIVCANTAQIADMDAKARGTEFAFRHSRNVKDRIEEARQALQGWRTSIDDWALFQEHLLDFQITPSQRDAFLDQFFPMPEGQVISDRVRSNIEKARTQFTDLLYGPTCEGIEYTAAGLVAATTEYAEHVRRAHSQTSRFNRTFLNRNQLVQTATKIAMEV